MLSIEFHRLVYVYAASDLMVTLSLYYVLTAGIGVHQALFFWICFGHLKS